MRRTSRLFLAYTAPPARRGRRIHAVRELWQGNRPARTKMPLCWQDVANMRSPGARRWQNAREMRSQRPMVAGSRPNALLGDWQWQYSRAMRSRVPCRGKMLAKCVPGRQSVASFALHVSRKWPRTGKSPVRGSISPPCIQNELILAGYARHASEKPRKQPFGNTPREDLAMKGPLSLHRPLESCTARESCHPLTLDLSATRRLR